MKKLCRRKHYALINPIQHAVEGAALTPESLLQPLRLRELAAIQAMVTGKATLQEWQDLADMLNLCETMERGGVGPEALPSCAKAQEALIQAAKRYESTQRMGLTAEGLQAIRDVYQYHDLQRQSVSRGQYERWIDPTRRRIKSAAPEVKDVAEA